MTVFPRARNACKSPRFTISARILPCFRKLSLLLISNYWMRLSKIWRVLHIKEGIINRSRRPRWITSSKICRILHILLKPNSISALLFIQNKLLKELFLLTKNNISSSACFLSQWFGLLTAFWGHRFNNLQRAALMTSFWCHRFNNMQWAAFSTSLVQYDKILSKFGQQQLVMVKYACDF